MKPIALMIAATVTVCLPRSAAQAADPTTADCLAASDASLASGNQHKLRAERSQLLMCAAASCPSDIRKECVRRVDEVNTQIPTIVFEVKDSSGGDLSAVKVTMDAEVLAQRLEGTALSIDPGEHNFTFETAGEPPVTKRFVIQQAQKDRRELISLGTPIAATSPIPTSRPTDVQPLASPQGKEAPPAHREGMRAQKILALIAGGIGVVGLGVGTAFGVAAMTKKSDAESVCASDPCGTQAGANKWSDAGSAGNISTIAFIVGGVGVVGGAVLWFTAPRTSGGPSTQVGVGTGVLQLKGTW